MTSQSPEPTGNLARTITSLVADYTQHRAEIHVDMRQFNVDASTVLTIISLHDGQNQLTITTSTIHQQQGTARGVVAAAYRTGVNTADEQYTQALDFVVEGDTIPQLVLGSIVGLLDQWVSSPAAGRRELAYA